MTDIKINPRVHFSVLRVHYSSIKILRQASYEYSVIKEEEGVALHQGLLTLSLLTFGVDDFLCVETVLCQALGLQM